jgi:hypothetical protein
MPSWLQSGRGRTQPLDLLSTLREGSPREHGGDLGARAVARGRSGHISAVLDAPPARILMISYPCAAKAARSKRTDCTF